jgi:hypothetical protein
MLYAFVIATRLQRLGYLSVADMAICFVFLLSDSP